MDDALEPPGPVVTNYPKDAVKVIFDDAIDRYQSEQVQDVLKTVNEVNNRLQALVNEERDRLSPALAAGEVTALRGALSTMSLWFERYKSLLA